MRISGNSDVAACTDNRNHTNKIYFQPKTSDTFKSYKQDETLIEMQSGNIIPVSCTGNPRVKTHAQP